MNTKSLRLFSVAILTTAILWFPTRASAATPEYNFYSAEISSDLDETNSLLSTLWVQLDGPRLERSFYYSNGISGNPAVAHPCLELSYTEDSNPSAVKVEAFDLYVTQPTNRLRIWFKGPKSRNYDVVLKSLCDTVLTDEETKDQLVLRAGSTVGASDERLPTVSYPTSVRKVSATLSSAIKTAPPLALANPTEKITQFVSLCEVSNYCASSNFENLATYFSGLGIGSWHPLLRPRTLEPLGGRSYLLGRQPNNFRGQWTPSGRFLKGAIAVVPASNRYWLNRPVLVRFEKSVWYSYENLEGISQTPLRTMRLDLAPGAPLSAKWTYKSGVLRVSWKKPVKAGTSGIQGYALKYSSLVAIPDKPTWTSSTSISLKAPLKKGTRVLIGIRAENAAGPGAEKALDFKIK